MKKFFLFTTGGIILLILGIMVALYWFFLSNEAPILQGELEYNIEYKSGLNLDIYEPTNRIYPSSPVLVYIHGGAWVSGSKTSVNNARFNGAFNTLREKGYAIVSPDYTLAEFEKSPFPDCLTDALDAMHWLEENAAQYKLDLNNVGLLGESAGGHIALMTAYHGLRDSSHHYHLPIRYLIDVYGPTDLYRLYQDQMPLLDSIEHFADQFPESFRPYLDLGKYLFGFDPMADSLRTLEFTDRYSPVHYVHDDVPDILLIHGDQDQVVPISQSFILQSALETFQIPTEMHILSGVDHAFRGANETQRTQVQQWISEFALKHYVKN